MKPKYILFSLVFLNLLFFSNSKNILLIQCVVARSISNVFEAIAITLADEHNVTLINRFDLNVKHPNITLLRFQELNTNTTGRFVNAFEMSLKQDDFSHIGINVLMTDSEEHVAEVMRDPVMTHLLNNRSSYDVLIINVILSEVYFRLAHVLKVPLVQVAASHPLPWQKEVIGAPNYMSTDNTLLFEPTSKNFYGRLTKFIQSSKLLIRYYYDYLPKMNRLTEKYFPSDTPTIEEISKNTSLLLVNTQEPMVMSKPKVSNFLEIGGIHCRPAKDLPKDFKEFINNAGSEGLIYMSLGLTLKSEFPQHLLKSILNVFRKLPQRVVFKVLQNVDDVPDNVFTAKWCPQQDILGHPNTKLFITHGGMLSLQEAVFHGVPVLVLPITLDQPGNAVLAAKVGYGRYLRFSKFSEEAFHSEIVELLSNKKYTKRVKDISILTKDINIDSKQSLKWWINYIIRHKGYPISKYNEFKHSTYYIDSDIYLFLLFVSLFIIILFIFVVILLLRFLDRFLKVKLE